MPNRVLRDWTTSESIDKLSLGAEVFFTRLIMKADDYGNYTANHKLLRSALFPLRDHNQAQVEVWIDECVEAGIVMRYEIDGKQFINIPNFGQRMRQMRNTFPPPADKSLPSGGQLAVNGRPETKRNRNESEIETKIQIFGDSNEKEFVIVKDKTVDSIAYKIFGVKGLNDFMHANMSMLNYPEFANKFMNRKQGDRYNDMQHLRNAYNKFIEKLHA